MSTNIFISYSHRDSSFVTPIVRLLRVTDDYVFQDVDSIEPGKKWREQIGDALAKVNLVVVFWCTHSEQSEEVKKEWEAAIEFKKDVLPILLDSTPLHPSLTEYQWLDFRPVVGPEHVTDRPVAMPEPASEASGCLSVLLKLLRFGIQEERVYPHDPDEPFRLMANELSKEIRNRVDAPKRT